MTDHKELTQTEQTAVENNSPLRPAVPAVDIYENEDEILIYADMPGVTKEAVSVNIDNGTLSLSGVRRFDAGGAAGWEEFTDVAYARTFSVPQSIDVARVEAQLKDGVLRLHLPKSEAAKPRQIEIKAA